MDDIVDFNKPMPISDADRELARRLVASMRQFLKINSRIPLEQVRAFIFVAKHEGLTVEEYARLAEVRQATMTRNLLDLGEYNRKRQPGFGLVEKRQDFHDMRIHRTFLTEKGRAFYSRLDKTLSGEDKNEDNDAVILRCLDAFSLYTE
jgi:DNA-binding MarR family transcriptional regulator